MSGKAGGRGPGEEGSLVGQANAGPCSLGYGACSTPVDIRVRMRIEAVQRWGCGSPVQAEGGPQARSGLQP